MRKFMTLLLLLALVVPLALPFASTAVAQESAVVDRLTAYDNNLPPAFGGVSVDDLSIELIDNPDITLVDVRQPEEYAGGHIPGAFNVPLRELAQNLDLLPDLDAPIVVICGSAFRSVIGMTSLQILGYTDVRSMNGGMKAWEAAEYAVSTDEVTVEAGEAPEFDAAVYEAVNTQLQNLPDGWGSVSATDLNIDLVENPPAMLIDVRTDAEWAQGYIAGATHMALGSFMSQIDQLPEDMAADIVVYCAAGHRGNMAATMLRTLGYTNVRNLAGGITAWQTAELPVEGAAEGDAAQTASEDPVLEALIAYQNNLPPAFGGVSVDDLSVELIDNPDITLVDVRQPEEYAGGHIPGAFNVPLRELAQNLDLLPDLDAPIVVICGSAFRSSIGMTSLQILGYTDVRSMNGGMKAWEAAEYAVSTDEVTVEAGEAPEFDAAVYEAVNTQLQNLPDGWGSVSATDLNIDLVENPPAMLIDVRTDAEWAGGYIAGAVHMPLDQLMNHVDELPEDMAADIVVYCAAGHRGNMAATMLRTLGYTNIRNLAGGITAWQTAELPQNVNIVIAYDDLPRGFHITADSLASDSPPVGLSPWPRDTLPTDGSYFADPAELENMVARTDLIRGAPVLRSQVVDDMINTANIGSDAAASGELNVADLFSNYIASLPASFNAVRVADAAAAVQENADLVILDVRTAAEFTEGHIAGAINAPLNELTDHLDMLPDQSADILVYCGSGHRSVLAMTALNLLGYSNAVSMLSGLSAWQSAGYPVTTDVATVEAGEAPAIDPALFEMVDTYVKNIPAGFYTIRAEDLNIALIENPPTLIDVRTPAEWQNGIIPGALQLELRTFMENQDQWPADTSAPVVIYSLGHRSVIAMMAMQMMGYEDVRSLAGGINAWTAQGYEVTTEAVTQ